MQKLNDFIQLLKDKNTDFPFLQYGDETHNAITKLATLLKTYLQSELPLPTPVVKAPEAPVSPTVNVPSLPRVIPPINKNQQRLKVILPRPPPPIHIIPPTLNPATPPRVYNTSKHSTNLQPSPSIHHPPITTPYPYHQLSHNIPIQHYIPPDPPPSPFPHHPLTQMGTPFRHVAVNYIATNSQSNNSFINYIFNTDTGMRKTLDSVLRGKTNRYGHNR